MGLGPTKSRGFESIGLNQSQTLGGKDVGGGMQDLVRRMISGPRNGQTTPVSGSADLEIGQQFTMPGSDDVTLELSPGLYLVDALYSVGFDAAPTSGYVAVDVSANAVTISPGRVPAIGTSPIEAAAPAVVFRGGGEYPVRAIGSHFADASTVSEQISITATRIA